MQPIELNGKVFCSNCGLTIASNAPEPVANTINPSPDTVNNVATEKPEEISFATVPEPETAPAEPMISNPEEPDSHVVPNEPVAVPAETESIPRKLDVVTEELSPPEQPKPITEEAEKDLGLAPVENSEPVESAEIVPEPAAEPSFESKISDLTIPSEDDFVKEAPLETEEASSYVEIANPGDEKSTLEASGILLDILGEDKPKAPVSSSNIVTDPEILRQAQNDISLDPVKEPEIPKETETEEKDDIYTLPSEVKVGMRNKKVKKDSRHSEPSEESRTPESDPKTEKKIEKLEEKIAVTPEPVIKLTPEEAATYDPDTIDVQDIDPTSDKSKVIKDYFSTAIERDKKTHKAKESKKNRKKNVFKGILYTMLTVLIILLLAIIVYTAYVYFKPTTVA